MKRKIRRIMAFFVILVVIATSVSPVKPVQAASKPQFTIKTSNANPKRGETFTAELWLEPNSGLNFFMVLNSFDVDVFELVEYKNGAALKEMNYSMVDYDKEYPDSVSVMGGWTSKVDTAGGQMCILTLKVKENAIGNGKIAIEEVQGIAGDPNDESKETVLQTEDFITKVVDVDGNEIPGGQIPIRVEIESLTLNKTAPFTMARGTSEKLTVAAKPANALEGKKVTWTSSDSKVVSVDGDGNIKAVGLGTARISATVAGKTASVDVTVNAPLTAIKLNKNTLALRKGAEQTLEVTYDPADTTDDKTVTWTSRDTSVATVDAKGKVSALKDGTTTITAKVGDKTDTCVVTVKEEPLTGIELSEKEITLSKNDTKTLEVIYKPEDTTDDTKVTWSSSDNQVATVKDGVVTAKGAGSADITATVGTFTATCKVNVEVALESISLNATEKTLEVGEKFTLEVSYAPEDATNDKAVTWTSSNDKVATVKDGVVTAVAGGTATITAKTAKGLTAECRIKVPVHTTGIELDKTEMTIQKKETSEPLKVKFLPENTEDDTKVTWTSSNKSVATVDSEGRVTGVKAGTAVIKATVGTFTATCKVNVEVALESISLNATEKTLEVGEKFTLEVSYAPEDATNDKAVTWTSSNDKVATVKDGVVTAVAGGTAIITAKTAKGLTAECKIKVPVHTTGIELDKTEMTIQKKETSAPLKVKFLPENTEDDKTVTWTSSDTSVATVDSEGRVTGVKAGTAVIKATVGKFTATCKVNVEVALESISLNATEKTLEVGEKFTLEVSYAPEDATNDKAVTWTSSNDKVATVKDGVVTAIAGGTAIITAKTAKGLTAECKIKVPVHMTGIELDENTPSKLYKGGSFKLQVNLLPANTTDEVQLVYSSSDDKVATVDANGVVTGVKAGSVEIKVQTVDGRFVDTLELEVVEIPLEGIAFKEVVSTLEEGQTAKLEILYNPDDTTDDRTVTWSSSDESVAVVTDGLVKACKAGKTIITAKVGEKEISYELTVVKKKVPSQEENKGENSKPSSSKPSASKPSTSKPSSPKTGDTVNVFSIMLVSVLAFIGAAWVITFKKKYRIFK